MPHQSKTNPPFFPLKTGQAVAQAPAGTRKKLPIFVNSAVDDYGLTAREFRVYGHIARRADRRWSWSGIEDMARVCRLNPQTVRKCLRKLVQYGLLESHERPGDTTLYRITFTSAWRPPIRIHGNPSEINTPPSVSQGSTPKSIRDNPSETDGVKGNPMEGDPSKEIQTPPQSPKGDNVKAIGSHPTQEEELYTAYPRKVGRPKALRAIRRALAKSSFDFLLGRTKLYAQTCNAPAEFIPHPSTWFSQERFNDDPATWRRTAAASGKPQPPRRFHPGDYNQPV